MRPLGLAPQRWGHGGVGAAVVSGWDKSTYDHDAQPRKDRAAVGLVAEEDAPGVLVRLLDEFRGGVDDAGDGALEVAVVASVELLFVAAGCRRGGWCGRGLHGPRPGRSRPAEGPRGCCQSTVRRSGLPDHRGTQPPDRTAGAVVTEQHWLANATRLFAWMIPGEARVYPTAEIDAAKAWVAGSGERGAAATDNQR